MPDDDLEVQAPDTGDDSETTEEPSDSEILDDESTDDTATDEIDEDSDETKEDEEEEPSEAEYTGVKPRPSFTEVKAQFPELFKKFPELREAFFREQKFTEMFPTVEDARDAHSKSVAFDRIESDLMNGSVTGLLDALERTDPQVMQNVALNFLPQVAGKSKDLYFAITQPIINRMIQVVHQAGVNGNNPNLVNSALQLANFIYGTPNIPQQQPMEQQRPAPQDDSAGRMLSFMYNQSRSGIEDDIRSSLNRELRKGLTSFGDSMQEILSEKILNEIDSSIASDQQHINLINSLWRQAARVGFSRDSTNRIKAAYLERARKITPAIRSKIVKGVSTNRSARPAGERSLPIAGRGTKSGSPISPKTVDYSKTSDIDILNDKVTFRR